MWKAALGSRKSRNRKQMWVNEVGSHSGGSWKLGGKVILYKLAILNANNQISTYVQNKLCVKARCTESSVKLVCLDSFSFIPRAQSSAPRFTLANLMHILWVSFCIWHSSQVIFREMVQIGNLASKRYFKSVILWISWELLSFSSAFLLPFLLMPTPSIINVSFLAYIKQMRWKCAKYGEMAMSAGLDCSVVSQEACRMVAYWELNEAMNTLANSIFKYPLCTDDVERCGSQDLLLNDITEFGMVSSSETALLLPKGNWENWVFSFWLWHKIVWFFYSQGTPSHSSGLPRRKSGIVKLPAPNR